MTEWRVLKWGVLSSFVNYVESFGGAVTIEEPAIRDPDGRFVFRREGHGDNAVCAGGVRFTAHAGLLDVTINRPGVRPDAEGQGVRILSIEDPASPIDPAPARIDIARVLGDGQTELLPAGAALFDFRYPPGHVIASVEFAEPAS